MLNGVVSQAEGHADSSRCFLLGCLDPAATEFPRTLGGRREYCLPFAELCNNRVLRAVEWVDGGVRRLVKLTRQRRSMPPVYFELNGEE